MRRMTRRTRSKKMRSVTNIQSYPQVPHLAPQLVALFWEVVEAVGGGASIEEVGQWDSAFSRHNSPEEMILMSCSVDG